MIACALRAGISKRELFEDYYIDEIGEVFSEYVKLLNPSGTESASETVDCMEFFGF